MNEKEELMKLIEDIKTTETAIWDTSKNIEEEQKELDLEIAKLEQDINDEKDLVTGKDKYTNAPARQTALKLAVKDSKEFQAKIQKIKEVRNRIKLDEINLNSMLRTFSVLKRLLIPIEDIVEK